jgi:cell division protein ZapA
MDEKTGNVIRIRILNQTISIRGDKDEKYIQQLAEYVDRKMREISQGTTTVDTLRVAVLAALNIADDYYQMKQKLADTDKMVGQKALQCVSVLDQLLS